MSEISGAGDGGEYWYNLSTGEVEHGRRSAWQHLMGPYATHDEAAHALETARRRTEDWDEDDERWRDAGTGAVHRDGA